jgi:hypothetical protein
MVLTSPNSYLRELHTVIPLLFSSLLTFFLLVRSTLFSSIHTPFDRLAGPKASSLLWGCEWDIHTSKPGEKYLDWADKFGALYKYKAAFGVGSP